MEDQLKIALVQTDLVWENAKRNRKRLKEKIESLSGKVDIIMFPEMFPTGFTMNAKDVAEPMDGKTVAWMKKQALKTNAAIVGSMIIIEDKKFYNRLLFVEPSGTIHIYDKRHTFGLSGEKEVYSPGNKKLIVDYKGWKICPMVCYDLRFPVWARNTENYDVLLFVANWPKSRIIAWNSLLKARAIENMCYCLGVNRIGIDETQEDYCGHSVAHDILGNEMTSFKPNKEQIEVVTLERNHINFYRNKLKFLDDKDAFTLV